MWHFTMIYFTYVLHGADAVYVAAESNSIRHNDLGTAGYVDAVASAVEAYGTVEVVYHSTGASNLRAKELTQVVMIADQVGHV